MKRDERLTVLTFDGVKAHKRVEVYEPHMRFHYPLVYGEFGSLGVFIVNFGADMLTATYARDEHERPGTLFIERSRAEECQTVAELLALLETEYAIEVCRGDAS